MVNSVEFKINENLFCEFYEDNNFSPTKGEYMLSLKFRQDCKNIVRKFCNQVYVFRAIIL